MNREEVYAGMFAKIAALKTSGDLAEASRRLMFVEELAPELFPAVYQNQMTERVIHYGTGGPLVWEFCLEWYVYVRQPDTTQPSSPLLNAVLDKALATLGNAADPTQPGTFETPSGVICGCSVNGEIPMWEGILGDRAVARVPLRILVPTSA